MNSSESATRAAPPMAAAHLGALKQRWLSQIAIHRLGTEAILEFD
jgi:hypothetical protein